MNNKLRNQAISNLHKLNIYPPYIAAFRDHGQVTLFERCIGFYVDATQRPEANQILEDFKHKHPELLPYAVIHAYLRPDDMGPLETYFILYVGPDENYIEPVSHVHHMWVVQAYAADVTEPLFSEFGDIVIESALGGITIC